MRRRIHIAMIALVLSLLTARTVFADPVPYGPDYAPKGAQESSTAGADYGPATASADYGPSTASGVYGPGNVGAQMTLLKTDDTVPLNSDDSIGLGGGRIIMMKGLVEAQQLCLIIESPEGQRVVVDGGWESNADYLYRYLCENGGTVDAWLITHPHQDHVGALTTILNDPAKYPLDIRNIYAATSVQSFLHTWDDASRLPVMDAFFDALNRFDQSKLHRDTAAGTTFNLGSMEVMVINTPYLVEEKGSAGNNSSVLYRITLGGKHLMVLGDISYEASLRLLTEHPAEQLKSEIVQMAHHGQHAGCPELYSAILPKVALWPSSAQIWNQTSFSTSCANDSYTPAVTMNWMKMLAVKKNYSMSQGNWVLK